MRIKKVDQAVASDYQVNGTYSTSQSQAYSCNYINSLQTYSTTEARVGTWINNKPIYRKVVSFNAPTQANTDTVVLSNVLSNCDEVTLFRGVFHAKFDVFWDISSDYSTSYYCTFYYNKVNNEVRGKVGTAYIYDGVASNFNTGYVVFEYTKTTD